MFKTVNQHIGNVKPGKEYNVYFEYEDIEEVTRMVTPCDCTLIYNEKKNNRIKIVYTPKDLAPHLKAAGQYQMTVQKIFDITYTDAILKTEKTEKINFVAVVKSKP